MHVPMATVSYLSESEVAVARLDLFSPTTRGLLPPGPYAYAIAYLFFPFFISLGPDNEPTKRKSISGSMF